MAFISEMTRKLFHDPRYLNDRAEETRSVALQILDAFSRRTMLEIAESYDSLARHAAQRLGEGPVRLRSPRMLRLPNGASCGAQPYRCAMALNPPRRISAEQCGELDPLASSPDDCTMSTMMAQGLGCSCVNLVRRGIASSGSYRLHVAFEIETLACRQ
jgi:hypothetical protein